ncbi:MAG: molecular chaperone HtpG [Gammaproteobacteria bacterium]|nr:molecular chaperone HtpG [Gammaproteobacteria bacterium]
MTTKAKAQTETFGFQAEVQQLLHLVTHSLYSNREIFLRELISNASDAADKLRFEALADSALYEDDGELKIWVDFDKDAQTITVRDNGIGMSREEVIDHLGTIAKSGTRVFLESLTGDQSKDSNMIGQFGVGFYSSFVVADKVTVQSRRAGMKANQGVQWESDGKGEYTIKNVDQKDRGTIVTLHLKKDEDDFLTEWRLRNIVTKYSDHILLPILMKTEVEVEDPDATAEADTEADSAEKDESKEKKTKTEIKEEVVNRAKALWTLPKKDIKEDDYKELYRHISHDFEEPLLWTHNRVEGKLEYTNLLYIPAHAPFDLWNREQTHGLKLYVQRVFIMDDAKQLLPLYLRFVRGIVDSNDLPLNLSRELLQDNATIEKIKSGVTKRVLDVLEQLAKDDVEKYQKFWQAFGQVMKEGVGEDVANKDRIAKFLRFATTQNDSSDQTVSLDEYIGRMPKDQKNIYYVTAESFTAAKNSPHLEIFRKKGIEVLLLADRVDEWVVSNLTEYEGKQLQSVAKGDLDLGEPEDEKQKEEHKKVEDEFASMIKQIKEVLGDKVKDVRLTHRLTDSPACLVAGEFDMSTHLQRIMEQAGQAIPGAKPILEMNPEHLLTQKLKSEPDDARFAEWSNILFDQALLAEGGKLEDPATFVKRLNKLLLELAS